MRVRFTKDSKDSDVEFKIEDKREVLAEVSIDPNILNEVIAGRTIVLNNKPYKIRYGVSRIEKIKFPVQNSYAFTLQSPMEEMDVLLLEVVVNETE